MIIIIQARFVCSANNDNNDDDGDDDDYNMYYFFPPVQITTTANGVPKHKRNSTFPGPNTTSGALNGPVVRGNYKLNIVYDKLYYCTYLQLVLQVQQAYTYTYTDIIVTSECGWRVTIIYTLYMRFIKFRLKKNNYNRIITIIEIQ